jgi:hypothetical protein
MKRAKAAAARLALRENEHPNTDEAYLIEWLLGGCPGVAMVRIAPGEAGAAAIESFFPEARAVSLLHRRLACVAAAIGYARSARGIGAILHDVQVS